MNEAILIARYKELIVARGEQIDPEDEHDWSSVALGFALGQGCTPEEAIRFSRTAFMHERD